MVLGGDGERVNVDARRGDVREVLVRLNKVEVITRALLEAVVAVEFDESRHHGVNTGGTLNKRVRVTRVKDGGVPEIGVVEWLLTVVLVDNGIVAAYEIIALDNPRKELNGVVEVHADLVGSSRDALVASELELFDEILVRGRGEALALLGIEVNVIHEEGGSLETLVLDVGVDRRVGRPAHVFHASEINENLDLVILEGNEREGETGVAAVEELERDVKRVSRGALADSGGRNRLRGAISRADILTALTGGGEEVHKLGHITHHTGVTALLANGERKLVPDVHPIAILLIDLLPTNLELDLLDKVVAGPVEPAERGGGIRGSGRDVNLGESGLNVSLPDKITVAGNLASDVLAVERGSSVERLLNRFNREVCVAAIHHLEESNLRVSREIHILSTISYELHKTTGHCIPILRKNTKLGTLINK